MDGLPETGAVYSLAVSYRVKESTVIPYQKC